MAQGTHKSAESAASDILAITPEQNTANTIESQLRSAGQNVHVRWVGEPQELGTSLTEFKPAVICCQTASDQSDLGRLLGLCVTAAQGIPVVPIVDEINPDNQTALMKGGASDVVSLQQLEHLRMVLRRELQRSSQQRTLADQQRRLEQAEMRLDAILAESEEARAYVQEGIHTSVNPAYAELFGFANPEELEGVPLMDLVVPEDRDAVKKQLSETLKAKRPDDEAVTFTGQQADDTRIRLSMYCRTVQVEGEPQVRILISRNIPTTMSGGGTLPGRQSLYHALADTHRLRIGDGSAALLYIQVDDLDDLEERLGPSVSDRLLDEMSAFLLGRLEGDDQSFRVDVGEFVLLAARESTSALEAAAESLRQAIDDEVFGDDDTSASLTASIAIVLLGESGAGEKLMLKAKRIANKASARGGNTIVVESAGERQVSARETDRKWLDRIKKALDKDRFSLAYQSIASLEGDHQEHHDVLLRMAGEKGEVVMPDEFLPTAARHGLMPMIDQWILRQIFDVIRNRQARKERSVLFVKVSEASIDGADTFLPWVKKQLSQTEIDPSDLLFSFHEEALLGNMKKAVALADDLKQLGFRIAISGFGTTSKSLQLLGKIEADFVKLDTSFTQALASDTDDPRLADAITTAQEKKTKIIAEHVEDANSMARLWQAGVHYVQGFYVQEPAEAARRTDASIA